MSRTLPALAAKLCFAHGGWIVGGACVSETPRDFDIVIPISNWTDAAMLVPADAVPNTFGGWKCVSEGIEIDVWPADLGKLMANAAMKHLWHPATGARFVRC